MKKTGYTEEEFGKAIKATNSAMSAACIGKGVWDETDHRPVAANDEADVDPMILEQLRYVI